MSSTLIASRLLMAESRRFSALAAQHASCKGYRENSFSRANFDMIHNFMCLPKIRLGLLVFSIYLLQFMGRNNDLSSFSMHLAS